MTMHKFPSNFKEAINFPIEEEDREKALRMEVLWSYFEPYPTEKLDVILKDYEMFNQVPELNELHFKPDAEELIMAVKKIHDSRMN